MNPDKDVDYIGWFSEALTAAGFPDVAEQMFGRELRDREIVRRLVKDPAYIFDLQGEPRPEAR